MKATSAADAVRTRARRNAAVVVEEPRIVVVDGAAVADWSALDDALGILVTWAIRACSQPRTEQRPTEAIPGHSATAAEAATPRSVAAYGSED